jgi:D-alanyl-D-alanine carboxypeptidase/D-alanyl-D-alanine-endopeptidase (penicillin-binding protein 4)
VEETSLADVMRRCNVDSYNLYAECLIKRLGHEVTHTSGSWANGSAVVRMVLAEHLGAKAGQSMSVADGSGMSRQNKLTPMLLAEWLAAMIKDPATGDRFMASLAEAGDEGTLARRFRGPALSNTVRAKTGYLSGVSAISGYVASPTSSRKVIFVIITNDKPNSVPLSLVRQAEESIVRLADGWLRDKVSGRGPSTGSR